MVKNPPTKQLMPIQSVGQEDPLEKEMATQPCSICLGNPLGRGAWWATVHEVMSQT